MPNQPSEAPRPQFRFPRDGVLFARLQAYAARHQLTNTAVVIQAVTDYLNKHDKENR